MSKNIAIKILEHPDREEIFSKLLSGVPIVDVAEWLSAKYVNVGENKFILSEKVLLSFQKDYLDFYIFVKEDINKIKIQKLSHEEELGLEVQGNLTYKKALQKYIDSELDINTIIKQAIAGVQIRVEQIYDLVQEDPQNIKIDRTLNEWFDTLITMCEKATIIQNGGISQVNVQNNVNIQVLDDHINVIYGVIKSILEKLDYDTSLLFIDEFNIAMQAIKPIEQKPITQEERLTNAQFISTNIADKLNK